MRAGSSVARGLIRCGLAWAIASGLAEAFADLRWPGWERDVAALTAGEGITCFPPLWSAEARNGTAAVRRSPASLTELASLHQEPARQLSDLPNGSRVMTRIKND